MAQTIYLHNNNVRASALVKAQMLKAIWIFFFLLFVEGALRKWIFPGLSTPLLIVRDPFAAYLVMKGMQIKAFKGNTFISTMVIVTVISFFATFLFGHGNLLVAIFGARIFLVYFPMIFVMGKVLDYQDVVNLGKALLWISIGMTVIIVLQYISPQSARINVGIGGAGSSGFVANGAGDDVFRPSGTFSFTTGVTNFYSLVAAYVFFFWLRPDLVKRYLLIIATFCLLIAIPVSISRGLLVNVIFCGLFAVSPILLVNPRLLVRVGVAGVVLFVILSLLSNNAIFNRATKAFSNRIESANSTTEEGNKNSFLGTVWDRADGTIIQPIRDGLDAPFFGRGLGLGTNVGAALATGAVTYLIGEGELEREFGEMGVVLGGIIVFMRLFFCIKYFFLSRKAMKLQNFLPWMLFSAMISPFIIGQLGQATALGFMSLSTGLMLGAFNNFASQDNNGKKNHKK